MKSNLSLDKNNCKVFKENTHFRKFKVRKRKNTVLFYSTRGQNYLQNIMKKVTSQTRILYSNICEGIRNFNHYLHK